MDRQLVLIIFGAIIGLTLIGVVYLGPSATHVPVARAHTYTQFSPDDIRYKFQKKEEDYAQKHKGRKPPADQITPELQGAAPMATDNDAPKNDETVEHDAVGEPPIE